MNPRLNFKRRKADFCGQFFAFFEIFAILKVAFTLNIALLTNGFRLTKTKTPLSKSKKTGSYPF